MDIDKKIEDLLDELNYFYTYKYINELTWDKLSFARNPNKRNGVNYIYLTVNLIVPYISINKLTTSEYTKQRRIKFSIGLKDKVDLNNSNFQSQLLNKVKEKALVHFGYKK